MRQDKSARQTKAGKRKTLLAKHLKPKDKTKTKDPLRRLQTKDNVNEIMWYKSQDWEFRKNKARKNHPALVVGEGKKKYANLGLTHSKKRGHHTNIGLTQNPNPNDDKMAYLRDDMQFDEKKLLKEKLNYKIQEVDISKIEKIINKKRYPLGGSH